MTASRLEKQLDAARKRLREALAVGQQNPESEELRAAHRAILVLEREVAASRAEEYAESIDFPVRWSVGAPMPLLLASDYHRFLIFYIKEGDSQDRQSEPLAIVEFLRCQAVKFGDPNDEVLRGHPLYGKGLEPYSAQVVRNSGWLNELEAINKVHSQYNSDSWRALNHYVLWFHDSTFECIAKSYEVQVTYEDLEVVIARLSKRLAA